LKTIEGGVNALNVVEEASTPTEPFSPNIRMNVLLAGVIGLVLSLGGIFIIEYLDDTISPSEDTQRLLNLPTLAKINRIKGNKNDNKLIALNFPLSPDVDSFRMLRMNIQSVSPDKLLKSIMFTSVEPSVGKSVTVSNLAIVMAQFGKRVILVDADLRKPAVDKLFGIKNEDGLTDMIYRYDLSVWDCLSETKIENLKILTCGSKKISSVEALGSERMISIIKQLSSLADVVLFDSPPASMFSDPYLMGKLVDGLVIVSQTGKTRTEMLKKVVNDLRMAGITLIGVVIQDRKGSDMYGYRYYQHYSESKKKQKKADNLPSQQKKSDGLAIEK
jgi:capsular exopolysaccharide synthesis family protein